MADTIRLDPHLWRVQLDLPPERGLTFALQVLAHAFMTLTADQPRAEPVCHNVRRSVVVLEGFGRPRQPCQGKKRRARMDPPPPVSIVLVQQLPRCCGSPLGPQTSIREGGGLESRNGG